MKIGDRGTIPRPQSPQLGMRIDVELVEVGYRSDVGVVFHVRRTGSYAERYELPFESMAEEWTAIP